MSSKDHVYPRPDLLNLHNYLNNSAMHRLASPDVISPAAEGDITDSFALSHDLATGKGTPFAASSTGLAQFEGHDTLSRSSILFMRGFASPQWLTTVGEKQKICSELYRRHLDFQTFTSGSGNLYSSPSLPSSSSRVFQLTIPTICTRNVSISGYEPEDLQQERRLESENMNRYFQQLRTNAKVADSVVRKCLLLSKSEYVLEQTVSIEVGQPTDKWRAILWLDNGRDLSQSVSGPWSPWPGTRAWETYFLPVIVHQDAEFPPQDNKDTALHKGCAINAVSDHASQANGKAEDEWRAAQNICLLPFQYGSRLNKDLASRDALYALSELFHFAASAEVQLLNLLQKRIEHEFSFIGVDNVGPQNSISLLNLKYIKTLLTSHAQRLAETIGILQNRSLLKWPRDDKATTAEAEAVRILADFEYLHEHAETLAGECEQGMATLANSSVLEESRRSADMATTVQRLTVIGTIFIPLSFVCSIWGMNFKQPGSGSQSMLLLFGTAPPVVFLSYAVYHWDTLIRWYSKMKSGNELKV